MVLEESEKNKKTKEVEVLGVKINPISRKEFRKKILYFLKDGNQHYIVTVNAEFLLESQKDKKFKRILNSSDIALPDGNGVILADYFLNLPVEIPKTFPLKKQRVYRKRKIRNQMLFSLVLNLFYPKALKKTIKERLSGSDVILDICEVISENDFSLYLLGGSSETSVGSKFALEKMFPNLIISGIKGGFNKEAISPEVLVDSVNKAQPDVLFVALGHPHQEKWIYQNLDKLPSVKLAIGIGGSLDFLSGKRKRAPRFLQNVNLEWLFRFVQEPQRWGRIKNAVIDFPKKLYQEKVRISDDLENNFQKPMENRDDSEI